MLCSVLLAMPLAAETPTETVTPADALVSGFPVMPVHWDKNIAVVDVCAAPIDGVEDIATWPSSTGELLKFMDALKYEYDLKYFQCVVFSLDAAAQGAAATSMLNAMMECVTVCDILHIPFRVAVRENSSWVEVAPTYSTQNSYHLMLTQDAGMLLFDSDNKLLLSATTVPDLEAQLKALAEKAQVVNLYWMPDSGNLQKFVDLVQLCQEVNAEFALFLVP